MFIFTNVYGALLFITMIDNRVSTLITLKILEETQGKQNPNNVKNGILKAKLLLLIKGNVLNFLIVKNAMDGKNSISILRDIKGRFVKTKTAINKIVHAIMTRMINGKTQKFMKICFRIKNNVGYLECLLKIKKVAYQFQPKEI